MIQRDVLLRSQIRRIYSSEKQQRMKVYFQLTQQYNQCVQPCKLQPGDLQQQCIKNCQKIYDKYAQQLKPRYQNNKQRLQMEVKNAPMFTRRSRPDRSGWFYNITGKSFWEAMGYDTTPKVNIKQRQV